MARISFDTFQETASTNQGNYDVKLFSLKDDGDEAIVRIMHDSTADFDIITTHSVKIGENYRKVSCIRDPREPLDNCPLCKSGSNIQQRFFIHMIQYEKDQAGNITATPVVWERAAKEYATKLTTLMQEYGPLSDNVFKIRRNGKKGDMSTTYEILYGNPNIYRADIYPKDTTPFEGYTALGKIVFDKTFEEINEFLATGNFPQRQRQEGVRESAPANNTAPAVVSQQPYVPPVVPGEVSPAVQQFTPASTPVASQPMTGGYVQPQSSATPPQYVPPVMPSTIPTSTTGPVGAPSRPARYY